MNFSGARRIPAPRQEVWRALNDTSVLQRSIPGCEELHSISAEAFQARIKTRIGPLNARFKTEIKLQDVHPPESYVLVAEGSGGAVGAGRALARVTLSEDDAHTELEYTVELKVRGKLAQIGSRLVANSIKKLSDDFFSAFASTFDE